MINGMGKDSDVLDEIMASMDDRQAMALKALIEALKAPAAPADDGMGDDPKGLEISKIKVEGSPEEEAAESPAMEAAEGDEPGEPKDGEMTDDELEELFRKNMK